MKILVIALFAILGFNNASAQELRIKSFESLPTDLTARRQPRQDLNGRQCALLKVRVTDDIVSCEGSIGDAVNEGMEKLVYVTPAAPHIVMKFKKHYPLRVVFADYGERTLSGGSTYVLTIADESASTKAASNTGRRELSADGISDPVLANIVRNMVRVDGGTFIMGSDNRKATDDVKNQHSVTLSDFYICKYEVTQEEWQAVMGRNPSAHNFVDVTSYPVDNVSWDDCQEFISKLNALTGMTFRLPTEAEWEYAARGGNKSKGYDYAGSAKIDDVAWYWSKSAAIKSAVSGNAYSHPVGGKQPNELGLYDMSGNAYEWCADWWEPYGLRAQTNPKGPAEGTWRCKRGGSWDSVKGDCYVWSRGYEYPHGRMNYLGLRLAMSVGQ